MKAAEANQLEAMLAAFLLGVPLVLWRGYVLSLLWGWFFVPSFHLPALSMPGAIGVCIVLRAALPVSKGEHAEKGGVQFAFYAVLLLLGWIVQHLM